MSRTRPTTLAGAVVSLVAFLPGCGDEARAPSAANLERMLLREIPARLQDLEVERVECVQLRPSEARCYADGTAPGGEFTLPVSVETSDGVGSWAVAEAALRDARRGRQSPLLGVGDRVDVRLDEGGPIRMRVVEVLDPLEVTYPEPPAKPGSRYIGVKLSLRNDGGSEYVDRPAGTTTLRLADGTLATPVYLAGDECRSERLSRVRLAPGETVKGCVAFEIPEDGVADRLAMRLASGPNIIEWRISRTEDRD